MVCCEFVEVIILMEDVGVEFVVFVVDVVWEFDGFCVL